MKFKFLPALLLLVGCTQTIHNKTLHCDNDGTLERNKVIYVAMAENAHDDGDLVDYSGADTSNKIGEAMQSYAKEIVIASHHESLKDAFKSASDRGADYLIYPEITFWQDVTFCNQYDMDEARYIIAAYDVSSKKLIHKSTVQGAGCPHLVNGIPIGSTYPTKHVLNSAKTWAEQNFQ